MTGISVDVLPDAGAPQVGITVDGLAAGTPSTISVHVSWDGGTTWVGVRDVQEITVVGATFRRDFVPPLNVEATYRLTVHSGATIPPTLTATITVASEAAWLQDPLNPRGAVPIAIEYADGSLTLLDSSLARIVRSQPVDLVVPEGARLPVASVGRRVAGSDVPLHLYGIPAAQGALVRALRALFDGAGQLVLRGLPDTVPLDPVAHVLAGEVVEVPVVGGVLGERNDWLLSVTQTRPTSLRIAVPWWTYDQVQALWAAYTYADAATARPGETYLDWLRDPEVP